MTLDEYAAIIGILGTVVTAIPVIRELLLAGSGHDRKIVSFAQEVLAGQCDEHQRFYWANARDHALNQIEARQAFPDYLKRPGLSLVAGGILSSLLTGYLTLSATTNGWTLGATMALAIAAVSQIRWGINSIRKVEETRGAMLSGYVGKGLSRPLITGLYGLTSFAYSLGLSMGLQGIFASGWASSGWWSRIDLFDVYNTMISLSLAVGLLFIIVSWVQLPSLTHARADAHLLCDLRPTQPSSTSNGYL